MKYRTLGKNGLQVSALMKTLFSLTTLILALYSFGQTPPGAEVQKLSAQIFSCEVQNKIDMLQGLFSESLKVVTSRGDIQTKAQYLTTLRSGAFTHDSISVEQSLVTVLGSTATVIGKGWFHMTSSGNKLHRHLSYMEVFVNENKKWKLMALYASVLPE